MSGVEERIMELIRQLREEIRMNDQRIKQLSGGTGGGVDLTALMLKAIYDANGNGVVDNSEKLAGLTLEEILALCGGGSGGSGDMLKSVYDTDDDGVVDNSEKASDSKFNIFQLDGDLWIVANAYYDFDYSQWNRIDTSKYAFALQLQGTNFIPGESVQGVNLWRAVPGTNPIGDFGTYGGWEAVQLWTGYGDTVVGGYSIELDGHGTLPYGRFIHTTVGGDEYTGILTNLFGDMSGKDVSSESSWFIGRKNDEFVIARMPSGSSSFSIPFRVDSSGRYFFMPATDEPATNDMVDGELTFFLDLNAGVLKGKYRYDSTTVYVFTIASLT